MKILKNKIKEVITTTHNFSQSLAGVNSLTKFQLEQSLPEFNPTEIHIALIELNEEGYLDYQLNNNIIICRK
jgi:hypothetical protein